MTIRAKALTVAELEHVNAASASRAQRVSDVIEKALRVSADIERPARLAARQCKGCFYQGATLATQAFTDWVCKLCPRTGQESTGDVPYLCQSCSESFDLCRKCGGDIDMERRSARFGRKAKKPISGMPECCRRLQNRAFRNIAGLLVYREVDGKRFYDFRCMQCGRADSVQSRPEPTQ